MSGSFQRAWSNATLSAVKTMGSGKTFWLALIIPLTIFLAAHGRHFFLVAEEETGDYGANALQIQRAKEFGEIHGNYSRFHFNHPGPAFFYVYAAGEALFHDLLPLTPAPGSAHSLAGLFLQCAFYAAALRVFARFFPRRQTVLLAIAASCVHFAASGSAFAAIWPPYQLLMPYFCAMVSAAALMAGDRTVLPLLVLAVCFCVHGHVAQPVFVGPAFFLAVAWAWRREMRVDATLPLSRRLRASARRLFWNRRGGICAGIIAVFLIPIILDALQGRESNLVQILNYARHATARKSLADSLVYNLSFLCYWRGLGDFSTGTVAFNLRHFAAVDLAWALSILLPLIWAWRRYRSRPRTQISEVRPPLDGKTNFVAASVVLAVMGAILAVFWGTRIEEEMYSFNSYFIYGLLALPVLLCVGIAGEYGRWPISLGVILTGATSFVLAVEMGKRDLPQQSGVPAVDPIPRLETLARQSVLPSPQEGSLVYLTFAPSVWTRAIVVAEHLSRHHIAWRVSPEWAFVFGSRNGLGQNDAAEVEKALWVSVQSESPDAAIPHFQLSDGSYLRAGAAAKTLLQPGQFPVTFGLDSTFFRTAAGITLNEPGGNRVWGLGPVTVFPLRITPAGSDVILTIPIVPFVWPPQLNSQEFSVQLGASRIGNYSVNQEGLLSIRIAQSVWNRESGDTTLAFLWDTGTKPFNLGLSIDRRDLAVGFRNATFALAPPAAQSGAIQAPPKGEPPKSWTVPR